MNKVIKFFLALTMCFSMGFGATACDWFSPVSSESESESEQPAETKLAEITVATAQELAAFNGATGVQLYNLSNFQAIENSYAMLETAYTFKATETVEEAKASEYANWIADYYVSVDAAVEAGKIGLAGSYDSWDHGAWIGFYSPMDVAAGEKIGLLASTGGTPWKYKEIVEFVGTFRCGAFDLENACAGVTLTVELCLTNPDDETDVLVVNSTQYTFAE